MADVDPYKGLRLSEQTSPPKLDQQLFASRSRPAPPPRSAAIGPLEEKTRSPAPVTAKPAPIAKQPSSQPASPRTPRFALRDVPLFKASFLFTQDEEHALEDLKLELRRALDAKVFKNDLIRCAVHMLLDDYAANGDQSYVAQKIGRR